jgi:DNA-binding FadR family transcriptional regulator
MAKPTTNAVSVRGNRQRSASEQVADKIRRRIEVDGLQPGDRIGTFEQLSTRYGVSRLTLREALRLLGGSHLVRTRQGPGGGVFVAATANEGMGRNVSDAVATMLATDTISLDELLDARVLLEVPLAGLAARNADLETVERLRRAIEDAVGKSPASDDFRLADGRFHLALSEAAGNELLRAFTRWILDVLQPSLVDHIGRAVSSADILDQHRAILRAVRRKQPAAAERAMRAHLDYLRDVLHGVDDDRATARAARRA